MNFYFKTVVHWSFDLHRSPLNTHTTRQRFLQNSNFFYSIGVQVQRIPVEVKVPLHGKFFLFSFKTKIINAAFTPSLRKLIYFCKKNI